MYCPVCQTAYPPSSRFCERDGAALVAPETSTRSAVRGPRPLGLVGAGAAGALGVVLLSTAGFFVLQTIGGPRAAATPEATPLPSEAASGAAVRLQEDAEPFDAGTEAGGVGAASKAYGEEEALWAEAAEPLAPASVPGALRQVRVPGGLAAVLRDGTDLRLVATGSFGRRDAPRALSSGTRIQRFQPRTLAGRDVLEVVAVDDRWATTYFWDYGRNDLHLVGTERTTGAVNVSQEPGGVDVFTAALGRVPAQTYRPQRQRPLAEAAPSRVRVMLGAYEPGGDAGFQSRLQQVRASGRSIRTGDSGALGLTPGYRVLYLGPYSRKAADRVLAEMKRYAGDAYLSTVR